MSVVALSILLAACGNGDDNQAAASHQSSTPPASHADAMGVSPSPADGTTAEAVADNNAGAKAITDNAHISSNSVSGELLAAMLTARVDRQRIDGCRAQSVKDHACPHFPDWLVPWSAEAPNGQAIPASNNDHINWFAANPGAKADHLRWSMPAHSHIRGLSVSMQFTTFQPVFNNRIASRDEIDATAATGADAQLLSLPLQLTAKTEQYIGAVRLPVVIGEKTLQASAEQLVRKGERFAVNQVLQNWETNDGYFVRLLVIKPAQADEARLCLNTNMPSVKRLACQRWAVPANWKIGEELTWLGSYVVDDRSTFEGQTGHKYWNLVTRSTQ
ncbi:MAG: hypothetical protein Q4D19_10835 [Lautropia sp.]|nr:hypothetical protein [Lautropia sp.]